MIAFAGALFSIVIMQRIQRRTLGFEKDYTALLLSLASSVKAGIDPGSALAQAEVLFTKSSEVAQELKRYNEVIHRGGSEHEALTAFGATIDHPDLALFKEAFALSRSEGSSLGETLYRLARVTRQRQSFRRKSKSAVAMQKLSAFGIIGCCSVVGIFQAVSNTKGFFETFQSPLGIKLFVIGMILIATGFIWMIRMTRVRI
jgi:Flp pilus assembly protein TadB